MSDVKVTLSVVDEASATIGRVQAQLEALSRLQDRVNRPPARGESSGGVDSAGGSGRGNRDVETTVSNTKKGVETLKSSLDSFTDSAGLGVAKSLLLLGGVAAFAGAVGKVVGDSIALASKFEHVTQRIAFSQALGRGGVVSQMKSLQRAAMGYADMGLSGSEAAAMIGTYSAASGSTLGQAQGQGRSIATFAKAFGLDPQAFAMQMGTASQYAGKNVASNAGEIFGAAQASGDAGRRVPELLGNAVSLLTQIQSANPFGHDGIKSALSEIVGITRLGGVYQSTAGIQNTMAGLSTLGGSISSSPYLSSVAMRAGFSMPDILFGVSNPKQLNRLTSQMYKDTGGNGSMIAQILAGLGITGGAGHELYGAIMATHGSLNGKYSALSEKTAKKLADEANQTPAGMLDTLGARIENSETRLGQMLIRSFAPLLMKAAEGIEGLSRMLEGVDFSGKLMKMLEGFGHMIAKLSQMSTYLFRIAEHFGVGLLKHVGDAWHNFQKGINADADHNNALIAADDAAHQTQTPGENSRGASTPFKQSSGALISGTNINRDRLKQTLANLESNGGDYRASSNRADDPSYGKYQFTPDTLSTMWSYDANTKKMAKRYGSYSSVMYRYFLDHPALQEKFMDAKLDEYHRAGANNVAEFAVAHNTGEGNIRYFKRHENGRFGYQDYAHRAVSQYRHPEHGFSDVVTDPNGNVFDVTIKQRPGSNTRKKAMTHR